MMVAPTSPRGLKLCFVVAATLVAVGCASGELDVSEGEHCEEEGRTEGDFVCEDGYWVPIDNGGDSDAGHDAGGDACVPESDDQFCDRVDDDCAEITEPDNCGETRTVDCGDCDEECPDDQTYCSGKCVDTSEDTDHCGECDNECDGDEVCEDGSCTCVETRTNDEICDDAEAECGTVQDDCGQDVACGDCGAGCQICEDNECVDDDSQCDDTTDCDEWTQCFGECPGEKNRSCSTEECNDGTCEEDSWAEEQQCDNCGSENFCCNSGYCSISEGQECLQ